MKNRYKEIWKLTYPKATADASANPIAADLPLPRAAVNVTVLLNVFSEITSMNFNTAFAYETETITIAIILMYCLSYFFLNWKIHLYIVKKRFLNENKFSAN